MFLLLFSTSKQVSVLLVAVFQGQYSRNITMQPILQVQWTDTQASFFSGKQQVTVRTEQKIYSPICDLCKVVRIFQVATSFSTFSIARPSLAQQRKQTKCKYKF